MPVPKGGTVQVTKPPVLEPKKEEVKVEKVEVPTSFQAPPPPTAKNGPPKQIASFGQFKLKSKFSLTKKDKAAAGEEEVEYSNSSRSHFTLEQLQEKWNSFCYMKKREGMAGLHASLTNQPLVLLDDNLIELTLSSNIQETELDIHKPQLLGFLRKELNNGGIQLKVVFNESQSTAKHMTSKDKFLEMAKKNEVLNEMLQRLNLDIEY